MDKRSVLAIVLITVIIILLPKYYDLISDGENIEKKSKIDTTQIADTKESFKENVKEEEQKPVKTAIIQKNIQEEKIETKSESFTYSITESEIEKAIKISTPLINAEITSLGGGNIISWNLNNYETWENNLVSIVDPTLENGLKFSFQSEEGEFIYVDKYNFFTEQELENVELSETDKFSIRYFLQFKESLIEKIYTFYGDSYHIDLQIKVTNSHSLFLNNEYQFGWKNGIPSNEENIVEDFTYGEAYASMGGELEGYDLDSEGEAESADYNGKTEWIAMRMKYFLTAVIPDKIETVGVSFSGEGVQTEKVVERKYTALINVISEDNYMNHTYRIYMGPLDNSILSDYDNNLDELIMNHGWYERTFRPISLLLLSVLKFFHMFIPNYGIVIIVFSVIIKIVVYPLTKKSYRSMKAMSKLQPLMAELKEKYKGDPQRYQKETMKLYKEHNINPLGGCVPVLLQLPLLGALFILFRSTIELRGASFIPGWIDDLSRGDTLATLPFSLPMYGDQFNLLPILMAVSMIFQSKMTMKDPKQKAMVYVMPIFLLLLFNQFPSGLNLYYTMFNVLTIIQQKVIDTDGSKKQGEEKKIPLKAGKKK